MEGTKTLVESIASKHPYKKRGNPSSFSQYNEGWSDACDLIQSQLEQKKIISDKKNQSQKSLIIDFLSKNDYHKKDYDNDAEMTFEGGGSLIIEIYKEELFVVDDEGNDTEIPMNYYALIGALIHFRQIPAHYKF